MMKNTGAAIMARLIGPEHDDLSADAAKSILRIDFPKSDHHRMAQLQAKANRGTLKPEDREELDEYLRVADMLAILQAKARTSLKRPHAAS
jgi:hypothetical protein